MRELPTIFAVLLICAFVLSLASSYYQDVKRNNKIIQDEREEHFNWLVEFYKQELKRDPPKDASIKELQRTIRKHLKNNRDFAKLN